MGALMAGDLWYPDVLALVLGLGGLYLLVIGPLRRRISGAAPVGPRRVAWFFLGLAALFVAEGTPVHLLSEQYLFSAHMVQHLLLTLILVPSLILGCPDWFCRPLLRARFLGPLLRRAVHPVAALLIFHAVYSLYHVPVIYQAGLKTPLFHFFQHVALVVSATFFWWPLLSPLPELPRLSEPLQLVYIFATAVAQTLVFALLTFADGVLYPRYALAPRIVGLTPLEDQQLGGILMKLGSMVVLVPMLVIVFYSWARKEMGRELDLPPAAEPVAEAAHDRAR